MLAVVYCNVGKSVTAYCAELILVRMVPSLTSALAVQLPDHGCVDFFEQGLSTLLNLVVIF